MQKDSNKFTFLFASVMVIIVAVLLSVAAIGLGPYQAKNMRQEKMLNILSSVGIAGNAAEAENQFKKYITEQVVINAKGEQVKGDVAAFDIDLKKELDKAKTGQAGKEMYPLFICKKDGKTFYIIPVRGKGLWGPIWGYISLEEDLNTVYGVSFGHKGETPGLGAEIETVQFQQQFAGKKIMDESGKFISVRVIKGGAKDNDEHGVDAVSGATVTSDGVSEMLRRTLEAYLPYFSGIQKNNSTNSTAVTTEVK
jgi:Na+-transporting NADH:ubiquinone oxidoreductase subunit C